MERRLIVYFLLHLFFFSFGKVFPQVKTPLFLEKQSKAFNEGTFVLGYIDSRRAFYILTKDNFWKLEMSGKRDWVKKEYVNKEVIAEIEFDNLSWVSSSNAAYLVPNGSGSIYKFEDDEIVKLQNSYDQRSNSISNYFIYKNCLYNYSGYGFWQFPSFLSKFDLEKEKLSAFESKKGTLVPPSHIKSFSILDEKEDVFYVWGGRKVDRANTISNSITNSNELWALDLNLGIWKMKGKVNMPNVFYKKSELGDVFTFKTESKLYGIKDGQLCEFDFNEERITIFKFQPSFNLKIDSKTPPAYCSNSEALLISTIPFPNQKLRRTQFVSLSNFKSELVSNTSLVKSNFKSVLIGFIILVILVGVLLLAYYFYKRFFIWRGKLILRRKRKRLSFNNKVITTLNEEEVDFIFWMARIEGYASTTYIMDRPSHGSSNYDSIKKRKLATMKSLELKLGTLNRNMKPVFIHRKSNEDLRLKECKLNNEWIIVKD